LESIEGHDSNESFGKLTMGRKINIGAGTTWYAAGWDVLDNAPGKYKEPWKHRGKCWDSGLPSDTYDIVFSSHMLEHISHFRMEKMIAEFNRIMKVGGTLRILVPSLKNAAEAYVKSDVAFFLVASNITVIIWVLTRVSCGSLFLPWAKRW